MKTIDLSFHPIMSEQILSGKKICTTRYHQKGEVGDLFWVGDHLYRIVAVYEQVLSQVADGLFLFEGFPDRSEFCSFWKAVHDNRWDPDASVFTHFFAYIGHYCRWDATPESYHPLVFRRECDEQHP